MSAPLDGQVGPYKLSRLLATGSQSQVWLADGASGPVALKLREQGLEKAVKPDGSVYTNADGELSQRFLLGLPRIRRAPAAACR